MIGPFDNFVIQWIIFRTLRCCWIHLEMLLPTNVGVQIPGLACKCISLNLNTKLWGCCRRKLHLLCGWWYRVSNIWLKYNFIQIKLVSCMAVHLDLSTQHAVLLTRLSAMHFFFLVFNWYHVGLIMLLVSKR